MPKKQRRMPFYCPFCKEEFTPVDNTEEALQECKQDLEACCYHRIQGKIEVLEAHKASGTLTPADLPIVDKGIEDLNNALSLGTESFLWLTEQKSALDDYSTIEQPTQTAQEKLDAANTAIPTGYYGKSI